MSSKQVGYFQRVDTHSSRACGQRVIVDFVARALIRVLLRGFCRAQLIKFNAHSPNSLPVITVSAPGGELDSIFSEVSGGGLEISWIVTFWWASSHFVRAGHNAAFAAHLTWSCEPGSRVRFVP